MIIIGHLYILLFKHDIVPDFHLLLLEPHHVTVIQRKVVCYIHIYKDLFSWGKYVLECQMIVLSSILDYILVRDS